MSDYMNKDELKKMLGLEQEKLTEMLQTYQAQINAKKRELDDLAAGLNNEVEQQKGRIMLLSDLVGESALPTETETVR